MNLSMVKEYQRDQNFDIYFNEDGQPIEVSKYKMYEGESVIAESLAARSEDMANLLLMKINDGSCELLL